MGGWLQGVTSWFQGGSATSSVPTEARPTRTSLGLEQFLPILAEADHPSVLDLGCVWHATVAFLTQAGCKVYTEDLFHALSQEQKEASPEAPPLEERFLASVLQYPHRHFRGVLAWDLFDYLPEELVQPMVERLYHLLEPGGALLLLFHDRLEDHSFVRYRVLDSRTVEVLPDSPLLPLQRTYANRTLLKLFAAFHSSRTFVGRDNLRELFLVK